MSNDTDFTLINNPLPEGQKVDLKLPLIETNESDDIYDIYFTILDFYRKNLDDRTILIYTDPLCPKIQYIYLNKNNESKSYNQIISTMLGFLDKGSSFKGPHKVFEYFYFRSDNINNNNPNCIGTPDIIKLLVDYYNWNVVMMTCDKTSKDFHIDRIFLSKK